MNQQTELRNVGIMNNSQTNKLVKQFEATGVLVVERSDLMQTVKTQKGRLIMSAARLNRQNWHVRAIPNAIIQA